MTNSLIAYSSLIGIIKLWLQINSN